MPERFFPQVSKLVGAATSSSWAQVFVMQAEPDKPQYFLTMAVLSQGETEAPVFGKEISESLLTQLPQENHILEKVKAGLNSVLVKAGEKELLIDASLGCLYHGCLYLAVLGKSGVLFCRDHKLAPLLTAEENEIKTASGFVREKDVVVFYTSGFMRLVSLETLAANFDHKPMAEVVESLSPKVLGAMDNSLAAALFLELKTREEKEPEEEEETTEEMVEEEIKPGKSLDFLTPAKNKLRPFWDKIKTPLNNISLPVWKKTLSPDSAKLSFSKTRSQKTTLTVALALLAILVFSVIFGLQKQQADKEHAVFAKYYPESRAKIEEAKAIADLNPTLSRSLLAEGKNDLQTAQKELQNKNSSDYKTIAALIFEADDLLTSVSRIYKINSPELFYDLVLIKDRAAGDKLGMYQNRLVVLDKTGQAVYLLSLETKSAGIIAGGNLLKEADFISVHGDKTDVFSRDTGIVEVSIKDKTTKNIIKTDSSWGEIKDLVDFAGNIYLLDSKGQIIKYVATDTGYSQARNYLRPDVTPDFSQSVGMAIDGSVWVLFKNGTITKFTQGRPDNFSPTGLDVNFSSPQAIFTYDEAKNIYILDSGNKRVVVLAKTGEYAAQYQWLGMVKVTDLVADEKLGKILLLAGNKIYSLNIK